MVTASPAIGFTGAITFACTSPVAYITCTLTPAAQTISGTTAVQSIVQTLAYVCAISVCRGNCRHYRLRRQFNAFTQRTKRNAGCQHYCKERHCDSDDSGDGKYWKMKELPGL